MYRKLSSIQRAEEIDRIEFCRTDRFKIQINFFALKPYCVIPIRTILIDAHTPGFDVEMKE